MAVLLSPIGGVAAQFFDNDGNVLSGGKIYTYAAGSTTPQSTYTTGAGNIAHANPIILDSAGRVPTGEIWLTDGFVYKFVIKDANDTLIGTYDNIVGINSNFVNYSSSQEIQTATAGQTVFTLTTMAYQPATNTLSVFVDGVNQYGPGAQYAYTETSSTSVTFASGLHKNASVKFTTAVINNTGSVDASQVSYNPPFTGGEVTNVEARLAEYISVKDFGATGDGSTNDTDAIQAAINYCTNLSNRKQTLYFPANDPAASYRITAPLVVNGRLNIVGDGQFSTTIYADGFSSGQFILDFNNEAAQVVYFSGIQNITLRSSNNAPTGVRLRNISYMLMKNVQLYGLTTGVYITGTNCFSNFFEQVTGYSISSYTVQWDNFTGGGQYMFTGCTFTGSDGVYITSTASTDALAFYDCNFEQCVTTDMYIAGTVSGLTISGCRSEGLNGPASFLINPSVGNAVNGITVTGCTWSTDFGNAYAVDFGGSIKGFSITGNYARYIGLLGFIRLNGAGDSGVISGNYCEYAPVVANGAPRAGVVIYANSNSSGALAEYWGNSQWGVTEGTWTPTDGSGAGLTFSPSVAKYTKIGRTVNLQLQMTFPTTSSTAQLGISNLPFAIGTNSCATAVVDTNKSGLATIAVMRSSTSIAQMFFVDPNSVYYTNAAFSGQLVTLSITYTI